MRKNKHGVNFLKIAFLAGSLLLTDYVNSAEREIIIPPKNPSAQKTVQRGIPQHLEQQLREQSSTYSIIKNSDQKIHAICKRGNEIFFDRVISEDVADTVKRLRWPNEYMTNFSFNPKYDWNEEIKDSDHDLVSKLNAMAPDNFKHSQTILDKAKQTLSIAQSHNNTRPFLQALDLLAHEKTGNDELVHAGIYYLANMQNHGYDIRKSGGIEHHPDAAAFTREEFYENILYARKAWREFSWARELSQEDFLNILLPARSTQEPLERWRRRVYEALKPAAQKIKTAEEAFRFINQLSFARIKYAPTEFEDRGFTTLEQTCAGRCEDQVNDMVQLGKAIGLPIVSVSVPWWGNANDNHVWAGIQSKDRILSVNAGDPAREKELDFNYNSSAPKVFLNSPFGKIRDATSQFTSTTDLKIPSSGFQDKDRIGLFVFNYGMPREVESIDIKKEMLVFKDVGNKNIIYIVGKLQQGKLEQLTHHFLLKENGPETFYSTHPHHAEGHGFYNLGEKEINQPLDAGGYIVAAWYDGNYIAMNPNNPLIAKEINENNVLERVHLALNCIYHLFKPSGPQPFGRPFTVEKGKVVAH